MNAIDYRGLAQEWFAHVVQQYDMTHVCANDLRPLEYLLAEGFTLVAVRDQSKVLHVGFLAKPAEHAGNFSAGQFTRVGHAKEH